MMKKQQFYISEDKKFFYSAESRDMYNTALSSSDEPLKSIKAEKDILFNNASLYVYRKNDEVIDYKDGELSIYESGPLWNGTVHVRYFCNIDLAKDYQSKSQNICDKFVNYNKNLLPQLTLSSTTITKKYKEAMQEMGWIMWKDEKPQIGDVIIFNKQLVDISRMDDCISLQHFNGKKFDNGYIYISDVLAWKNAPSDYPGSPVGYWDEFCQENNLIQEKLEGYRKYHFATGEKGSTGIEYDEGVEETEV
ncbi:hypothetical protein [Butyrivibrio sp. LC3010]|uniref:hypothetical protein n=1 Tax=Butyrivibrio sp. LC3010 TaxID=1280680 RepID=UPI0004298279|nr:hypothetical protein [Butyrivibrio sp. LC3010]